MPKRVRVMVCFGTRPEVIKLAPVVAQLRSNPLFDVRIVTTAQHREMLDQMLATFGIEPDVDLRLMRARQTLHELTGTAMYNLGQVVAEERPDAVVVQGDTTTVLCASLSAYYERIPVAHVEAGLRSGDPYRPFPEEMNRRLTSAIARWHFCPTQRSAERLLREGVSRDAIEVTGNTVVDALVHLRGRIPPSDGGAPRDTRRRILVTLHRRETQGEQQRRLCEMLARVAQRDDVEIVFALHLNPAAREAALDALDGHRNVRLLEPVEYERFVGLMRDAYLIVTDSGGVQEEAPSLDTPVLVVRETTERPEGVEAGCARLSGIDPAAVERDIVALLEDERQYAAMASVENPYGDGRAAERIVSRLDRDLRA